MLTPGIYTASIYAVIYVDNGSTYIGGLSFGIVRNTVTTPASSGTAAVVDSIGLGVNMNSAGYGTASYFPTFTFKVTTSGYYYSYMQSTGGASISGTYVLISKLLSIVRVG